MGPFWRSFSRPVTQCPVWGKFLVSVVVEFSVSVVDLEGRTPFLRGGLDPPSGGVVRHVFYFLTHTWMDTGR